MLYRRYFYVYKHLLKWEKKNKSYIHIKHQWKSSNYRIRVIIILYNFVIRGDWHPNHGFQKPKQTNSIPIPHIYQFDPDRFTCQLSMWLIKNAIFAYVDLFKMNLAYKFVFQRLFVFPLKIHKVFKIKYHFTRDVWYMRPWFYKEKIKLITGS